MSSGVVFDLAVDIHDLLKTHEGDSYASVFLGNSAKLASGLGIRNMVSVIRGTGKIGDIQYSCGLQEFTSNLLIEVQHYNADRDRAAAYRELNDRVLQTIRHLQGYKQGGELRVTAIEPDLDNSDPAFMAWIRCEWINSITLGD